MLKGKKFNAFALLNIVSYGCRQLPATLLPYADNVAAICQQPCWRLPTIK